MMTVSISQDVLLDTYVSVEQSLFPLLTKLRYYIWKFKCTFFPSRHNILIFYYLHHLHSSYGFLILNSFFTLSLSNFLSLPGCLSLSISLTLSLSLNPSPYLFLHHYFSLCLFLTLILSLLLYLFSLSHPLNIFLCNSFSLTLFL